MDAVYYPYFQPPSSWLRRAALCWDTVHRFRPSDAPPDPEDVAHLNDELGGVLGDISLVEIRHTDVGTEFLRWVDANLDRWRSAPQTAASASHPLRGLWASKLPGGGFVNELVARGLAKVDLEPTVRRMPDWEISAWKHRHYETPGRVACVEYSNPDRPEEILSLTFELGGEEEPPHRDSDEFRHAALIARSHAARARGEAEAAEQFLRQAAELRERHLVEVEDSTAVVMVPDELADHYLALVAREWAELLHAVPVAGHGRYTDVVTHAYRALHGKVAEGVLDLYIPKDIDRVELARLRAVRDELAHHRRRYHAQIDNLIDELVPKRPPPSIAAARSGLSYPWEPRSISRRREDDADASNLERMALRNLEAAKQDLVALGHEQVRAVQAVYRKARLDATVIPLGLTLTPPAVFAALGSALGIGLFGPLGVGAAVGIAVQTMRLGRGAADAQLTASPWSYVLDVQRELA